MEDNQKKKLSLAALILMIFTSVFGFANIPRAYYLMGYASIIWYIFAAICFFLPYAFMLAEFGSAFSHSKGGIYTWMSNSVNPKFAFIGIFMWYASYIVWMINTGSAIWVPLSNAIFGSDTTSTWSIFGLTSVQTIGILASLWMIGITFLASRGIDKIKKVTSVGGVATMSINVILVIGGAIILLMNGHSLQPMHWSSIFISPNPSYTSLINVLSFVVFSIFAFGGLEAVSGLIDETKNAKKNFPLGITISAITISVGYALGIFMMGAFTNWNQILGANDHVNLVNVPYIIMKNFGYQLGMVFHFSKPVSLEIGIWISRYVGLSMFLAYCGAFITLIISPITQLVEGTPKEVWPKFFTKANKIGAPRNAMIVQCSVVVVLILLISFGGNSAKSFFDILVEMTNVAMSVPYLFITFAFLGFKKNKKIKKNFVFYKNMTFVRIAVCVVMATVGLAILFTVIAPLIDGNYMQTVWMILGPVIFGAAGYAIYHHYEKTKLDK